MLILVVDDDRVLADVLAFTLRREGFEVIQAFDGRTALERWAEEQPDLLVLDVNLPKLDGFSVCQHIRTQSDTPILLLTVRDQEDDIIHGLDLGADDYITKPFSPRQLVARVHAILRRAGKKTTLITRQAGDLSLDPSRRCISMGEESITLTPLECQLLNYLMLNAGHVLTYEAIINHVWGPDGGDRDMLRQLVHRLRGKITQLYQMISGPGLSGSPLPDSIETVPGLGYGLTIPPSTD